MKYKKLLFTITFSILAGAFLLGNPSSAEAAIAFRSATTTNNTTSCNTQSVTVNVPAGTVNGDVMVVGVQYGGSTQMTTPSGWTLINHVNNSFSTTQNLTTFYRVASSEPASYTWTMPSLVCWITAAASYSGVNNSTPVDAQTIVGVTTGTSLVANAVTTTMANDTIVTIFAGYNGTSTTWTPPGGQTERVDSNNTSVRSIELNDSTQASVGSSGSFTATASVSNYGANATIALKTANTAPTITSGPFNVSGGSYPRLSANNPNGTFNFTATDAEQTGANALTYYIHTGANRTGTLVGSGTFTSGASTTPNIAYNASGIVNGTNTLYFSVYDGTFYSSTNPTFTLLRDDVAPTSATSISTTPGTPTSYNYTVTFTPNDAVSTSSNEISYKICTANDTCASPITGGTGTSTNASSKTTGSLTDSTLANGSNNRWVRTCDGANNCTNTGFTVTFDQKPVVTTSAASSVTTTSVNLNSIVNPNNSSTNVSYLWGTSNASCSSLPNTLAGPTGLTGTSNVSPNATPLSSLSPNTTYYFCVMATNGIGTNYGSVISITTSPTPGAYKMMDAGSVLGGGATDCDDATAAPCPPVISSVGSPTLTSLTVTWSAGTGPTQTSYDLFWCDRTANGSCTPSTQITNVTSAYVHNATITCGRTYAYSIRANNASGASADSNVVTGSTSACATAPSITAQGVNTVTTNSVNFTSTVNGNGTSSTITYRYGPSPTYNSGTPCSNLPSTIAGTNSGFTGSVSDSKASGAIFSANTTYFYCATANNAGGTTNGVSNNNLNSSFTTLKANGTTCSAGAECGSGFCYVDNDNDRYAPSSGTATCRANTQIAGTDCYDSNGSAFPGQTSYFTSNRGDGSFDYNCDSNYTNNMTNQTTAPGSMPSRTYCVGGPTLMYYAYSYCSNPCSPYCCGTSNACDPHYYCSSYTTAAIACGNTYTLFSSGPSYTSYYYGNTCSGGNNTNVYGYYESNSSSSTVGCR